VLGGTCSGCRRQCALPTWTSSFKRLFKAKSPPDKEKGSDAAGRHPASPLVEASAVNAIIRGMGVREEAQMLFLGSMGVCVSVCVCVCEHPRRHSLLSLSSSPSEASKTGNSHHCRRSPVRCSPPARPPRWRAPARPPRAPRSPPPPPIPRGPDRWLSSGFYSQNGRWPDPKSSKQKGGAGYFPNYSIFCILLECCC